MKAPDFAFVAVQRLPNPEGSGFVPVVPDLVIETRSPGDSMASVREKVQEWLDAGVRVVLALDSVAQTVTVYRPASAGQILTPSDTLAGLEVLPGFTLPLSRVFPTN